MTPLHTHFHRHLLARSKYVGYSIFLFITRNKLKIGMKQVQTLSRLERLYQTPKEMKASLSSGQALKFIIQNEALKLRFSNLNHQILSSKSNVHSPFVNLFNFRFSTTCWKSPKLYKRILAHFEKMSLARWFWAFVF